MTELSRSLLAAARDGLAPDAAVAARVRAKVAASIAAGAAATAVATPTASTATASTAPTVTAATTSTAASISTTGVGSSSLVLKLGAALLVVGAITTAALVTRDRTGDAPRMTVSSSPDLDEPRGAERTVSHDSTRAAAGVTRAGEGSAPIATSSEVATTAHPNLSARAVDPSAIEIDVPRAAEPVSLSREVELIDLAMASLRKHAPAAALAAIHTFDRETLGRGQMAEEAAAIAIEARCGLHQDVSEPLAAFDRAWPSSAQRSRVVSTCFAKQR